MENLQHMEQNQHFMHRALELAQKAEGRTSPNPAVGAVIVRDGRIIAEGYHRRAGTEHAEVVALQAAGQSAAGATMYVTLEPCNHFGKTPPCTEAIITAGIREVYYAVQDSDERVLGSGHKRLLEAGITVHEGLCREQAEQLNRRYFHYKKTGRPWVFGKFAASLDGKIATRCGESQWITGDEAREHGHRLRSRVDAILAGVGTVIADDPLLTCRSSTETATQPLRVILDSSGRTPIKARVLDTSVAQTLLATTSPLTAERQRAFAQKGVQVEVFPADEQGRVSLLPLLQFLGKRGLTSILVEGGAAVLGSFFQAGLIDELLAYFAPIVIGGEQAPGAVGGNGFARLQQAACLRDTSIEQLGRDFLIKGLVVK